MLRRMMLIAGSTISMAAYGQVVIDTVVVGSPGNIGQPSGAGAPICGNGTGAGEARMCGAVDYVYEIGKFEVTAAQYVAFLNAVARTDTYGLYNTGMSGQTFAAGIVRSGVSGSYTYSVPADWADRPIAYIAWADALRFANWMHHGQPTGAQDDTTTEDGSYTLHGATTNPQLQAIVRNPGATWVVPNEDEWYKAAFHKNNGPTGSYSPYSPQFNAGGAFGCAAPSYAVTTPDSGNNANWSTVSPGAWSLGPPYWKTVVGEFENSQSAYGTYDQSGNVWEWTETRLSPTTSPSKRVLRGGSFYQLDGTQSLHAAWRGSDFTAAQLGYYGFRLAKVNPDCDGDGVPDQDAIQNGLAHDDNYNSLPDACDIASGRSADCNANGIPDEAEVGAVTPTPYTWDDSLRDNPVGFGLLEVGNIAWMNHFTVRPGDSVIDSISLSFGYCTAGTPVTVCIWSDPDGDGFPNDAAVLSSAVTVVTQPDSDVMHRIDIPDVDVGPAGTSFYVGAVMHVTADDLPVNLDSSGQYSGTPNQSWLAIDYDTENTMDPGAIGSAPYLNVMPVFGEQANVIVHANPRARVTPADVDHNGLPDDCVTACDPDVNQDGNSDQDDVAYLINVIGGGDNTTGIDPDFNHDGNADQDDVSALINVVAGGTCP